MTRAQYKSTVARWEVKLDALMKVLGERNSRYYHGTKFYYCANVKLNQSKAYGELRDIIHHYPPELHERLEETFPTGKKMTSIWEDWVECEQEDLRRWLAGHDTAEDAYYEDELIPAILDDVPTGMPLIDNLPSKAAKLNAAEKAQKEAAWEREAVAEVDMQVSGFYGRSGGWFCIQPGTDIDECVSVAHNIIAGDVEFGDSFEENLSELKSYIHSANIAHRRCEWVREEIERRARSMDFQRHLMWVVSSWIDEQENIQRMNTPRRRMLEI